MFILIMVIILGTCVSVLSSIYYNTIALQKTYGSVNTYYGAYYGAMSSIERGLLMTKIKYPGYEGEGGFKGNNVIGSKSNTFSGDFRKLNHSNNAMTWSIKSKTDHINGAIDNQTLRYISFQRYKEDSETKNEYVYINSSIDSGIFGVADGLSFSGNVSVRNSNTTNDPQLMMDFNRFLSMKNSGYTIRGLLDTKSTFKRTSQSEARQEREYPLTGNFFFGKGNPSDYESNPRPTIMGQRSIEN